ncbi:MAG TPA: cytochrome c [Verrucomicrobiae bacterium]|jgi:mono/diheme cytochrome c family protein
MRYFLLIFVLLCLAVYISAGRRGSMSRKPPIEIFADMVKQPKVRPQTLNGFFDNGMSSQLPVPGTVARGSAYEDLPVTTGKVPGTTNWVETIPLPVTNELLARGQQRFNINCSPCHGASGDGKGITTKFGMAVIADLHDAKTRKVVQQADGEIFNTITYGKNLMGPYGANVTIEDRWAIIAYLRTLQRSHLASIDDVPDDKRAELTKPLPPGPVPK